jgi:hypothetical protein
VQETCDNITGCRGARLLVWLILNDRVQPSFIAGVCIAHNKLVRDAAMKFDPIVEKIHRVSDGGCESGVSC